MTARPRAPVMRCTALLIALAWLSCAAGTIARPAVMIGTIASPLPIPRIQVHRTTSRAVMSTLMPHIR